MPSILRKCDRVLFEARPSSYYGKSSLDTNPNGKKVVGVFLVSAYTRWISSHQEDQEDV